MFRIGMSEFMDRQSVSRLIGAPPGHVGYEEGGALAEAVRRRPYQVTLFGEVEKANPDVFNVLLQVLDDGLLTDGQGRTVDFRNTLVILTSNLGSETLTAQADGVDSDAVRNQVLSVVCNWLAATGYDPVYGARPLKQVVQTHLQNLLPTMVLEGTFQGGETVQASASDDGLTLNGA